MPTIRLRPFLTKPRDSSVQLACMASCKCGPNAKSTEGSLKGLRTFSAMVMWLVISRDSPSMYRPKTRMTHSMRSTSPHCPHPTRNRRPWIRWALLHRLGRASAAFAPARQVPPHTSELQPSACSEPLWPWPQGLQPYRKLRPARAHAFLHDTQDRQQFGHAICPGRNKRGRSSKSQRPTS